MMVQRLVSFNFTVSWWDPETFNVWQTSVCPKKKRIMMMLKF